MDTDTAHRILTAVLGEYRRESYQSLAAAVGRAETREVRAPDGTRFQVELQVTWDTSPGGAIRVLGAIDDGRLRAFYPLTSDFIRAPDGSFIGEE